MSTPSALLVKAELAALADNGRLLGWTVQELDELTFVVGLPSKGGPTYHLRVACDGYPATPPAWHWFNPATGQVDDRAVTPRGGTFFHPNGVVCAPWNRLAYANIDSRGPHSDWEIGAWQINPNNGACRTLSAMCLRIAFELLNRHEGCLAA